MKITTVLKSNCILLVMLFSTLNVDGKNAVIDSLKDALVHVTADSVESDIYFQLCIHYQDDMPDSALLFSRKAESAALRCNDPFRLGRAMQARGVSFDIANNLDSCLYYLKLADSIYTSLKRFDKKATAICDMGVAYYMRGNYELALRNYLNALSLMNTYSPRTNVSKLMNNIGLVYRSRKDYPNAIRYYQSSLVIKREDNDEKGILNTTLNIGSAFQRQEQFDSAYYYANEAKMMAEKLSIKKDMILSKVNMGAALASLGKTAEAIPLLQATEKEAIENNFKQALPTIYESFGSMYKNERNMSMSLHYYFKALALAQEANNLEQTAIFLKEIAKTFAMDGDFKNAYNYSDSSKTMYDSLLNIENSRQVNEMSAVYETSEKENEIQKLNSNNRIHQTAISARKNERNYFILSTLLFIGLSVISYSAYKGNRRKKNQLDIQNKLIEKSLQEKEILLKEIHHRVKNNLQIVSSLLSLQSNYISDERALDAVRESKNRVQSMAIIHQHLYQDESMVNIDVKEYVEKLTDYLFQSYNIHDDNIKLEMDIQPLRLDVDTLVPLGLVLNELINNCLKYAFPTNKNGKIKVILKQDDYALRLSVYDNGIGIQGKESHFDQNSFGHKMINAFMKKLKGEIRIYNEDGTKVDIEIKNRKTAI